MSNMLPFRNLQHFPKYLTCVGEQLLFLVAMLSIATPSARAQRSAEDRTLQTMYFSGLTDSAIAYTQRQIVLTNDTPNLHAKWTQRLMESYGQAALRKTSSADSQRLWRESDQVLHAFQQTRPENPRLPWLFWQQGRCRLLQAQSATAQYLAAPANKQPRDSALALVREILSLMEKLEDDIKERQPIAAREVSGPRTQAPADQLSRLRVDAGLLRCEALLIRASLYPRDSRDRRAAATDAESQAADILGITGRDWSSRSALEVAQAIANLELGRSQEALKILTKIATDSGNRMQPRAASVAIEYLAENSGASRARGLLAVLSGPDLSLAKIRIGIAELEGTSDQQRAQKLERLLADAKGVGEQYGAYWRNRAESLLLSAGAQPASSSNSNASLELMLAQVRQLINAEQQGKAIKKLLEFRDNETALGNASNALKLAQIASASLQGKKDWAAAAEASCKTAIRFKSEKLAPEIHMQSIQCLLEGLKADFGNTDLRQLYETSLIQQLTHWPEAEESEAPRQWLVQWLRGQKKFEELAKVLLDQVFASQKISNAQNTLQSWLAVVLQMSDRIARQKQLDRLSKRLQEGRPAHSITAGIYLLAAELLSHWPQPDRANELDRQLRSLRGSTLDKHDMNLIAACELLRLVQTNSLSAARRKTSDFDASSISEELLAQLYLAMAEAVDETEGAKPSSWCDALGWNSSTPARLLKQRDPRTQILAHRIRIWLGDNESLAAVRELAKNHSRNAAMQLQLAKALAPNNTQESTQIARRLVFGSKSGSDLHFQARWLLIRNKIKTGDTPGAQRDAKKLLAAQPFESELWKARFEDVANN